MVERHTHVNTQDLYTHNYEKSTVVAFTIILIAAHKLVFTELKLSMIPFSLLLKRHLNYFFTDNLKKYYHLPVQ